MVFQKYAILFVGIFFSINVHSAQSSRYLAEDLRDSVSVSRSTTQVSDSEYYPASQSRLQLVIPSFVVHGFQPEPDVAAAMPRKMNSSGDEVLTPGIGLEYKIPDGLLLMGAVIKDCFNNLAGTIQIGVNSRINRDSNWGFTLGVYARETPLVCAPGTNNFSGCYAIDGFTFKTVTYINGESVDIIPLPFFHYSYNLFRSREVQVNFKVMANFLLNEVGLEIPL